MPKNLNVEIKFQQILSNKPGFKGFLEIKFLDWGWVVKGFGVWERDGQIKFFSPAKKLKSGKLINYFEIFDTELFKQLEEEINKVVREALNPSLEDLENFEIV